MNQPQLSVHDTAVGFTGNLDRASLSADELAARQHRSRQAGHATTGYPQPGGAIIYQRGDGAQALGNLTHMEGARWHWTTFAVIVSLVTLGLMWFMSDSVLGAGFSQLIHKLVL